MKRDVSFDRRKYPRVHTESIVSLARLDRENVLASAQDLSMAGIRFRCVGLEVEPGDIVRVQLTLADQTVAVVGELVRVTELDAFAQEVALAFVNVDDRAQAVLREALPESYELEPDHQ